MLTPEQVAALSGRELDAAVAEHVMGWKNVDSDSVSTWGMPPDPENYQHHGAGNGDFHVPRWGTGDANSALAVLCQARGEPPCDFSIANTSKSGPGYLCELTRDGVSSFTGYGATIAECICRCALLAAQGVTPGL